MTKHLLKLIWTRKRSNALLIVEIFFSFLVLYAVTVTALNYIGNYAQPLGYSYEHVWAVDFSSRGSTQEEIEATLQQLLLAIREFPEVTGIAGTDHVPYSDNQIDIPLSAEGRQVSGHSSVASDDFLNVMKLRLTQGRWFEPSDDVLHWTPVVITERLSRQLFGDDDPLGKRVNIAYFGDNQDHRVVGIVEEYRGLGEYSGLSGHMFRRGNFINGNLTIVISTNAMEGVEFEERLAKRLQMSAHEWTFDIQTLSEMREKTNRTRLVAVGSAGIVAGFLMLMVVLGLTGVLWQNVTRRTQEFGLRRAVGGTSRGIRLQILVEVVVLVTIALIAGITLVLQIPLLGLFGFIDPIIFFEAMVLSLVLIYLLALLAGLYPSWSATRITPVTALHYE